MKCGNIVIIDIAILKATLPWGWTKLFDIPSGYLPLPDIKNVDMYYIGSMYVKNSDISKRIRVTNNVVYGYSDTSISGELYGMIVYVCGWSFSIIIIYTTFLIARWQYSPVRQL